MSLTSKILDIVAYIFLGVAALVMGAAVLVAIILTLIWHTWIALVVGGILAVSWALVRVSTGPERDCYLDP